MVDIWADHVFVEDFDYEIIESPNDPYSSSIDWKYYIEDINIYTYHPDFSRLASFNMSFTALEWNDIDDTYLFNVTEEFTFQPTIYYNLTTLHGDDLSDEEVSIYGTVPENQFNDTEIFTALFVTIWREDNESSLEFFELTNPISNNYISQDSEIDYHYIIHYDTISGVLPSGYELTPDSVVLVELEFISDELGYDLSNTPFNYDYVSIAYSDFHIKLTIGGSIVYSNDTIEFAKYVQKIEENVIYFTEKTFNEGGYIANNTEISIDYVAKLQPGLIESKHFLAITYPWSNIFDTLLDGLFGAEESTDELYRERFRKLTGGSIISPFEYSLSMNDTYSLYLSYRLTQKDYFEQKFIIDYTEEVLEFEYMSDEMDNYVDELEMGGEIGLSVYYFNKAGEMIFLDESHYELDTNLNKVTLFRDGNELAASNYLNEFYVGFAPEFNDKQFLSHTFSYDPSVNIMDTINVEYWQVENGSRTDIVPNLNAMYFIDQDLSNATQYTCRATQIGASLREGTALVFDLAGELGWYDPDLLTDIQDGKYSSLYAHVVIKNYEALENLTIEYYEGEIKISACTEVISIEELINWNFNLRLTLPPGEYDVTKIKIVPRFNNEEIFDPQNTVGIPRYEFIEYNENMVIIDDEGNEYYVLQLENSLWVNSSMEDPVMIFNENFDILNFTEEIPLNWTLIDGSYEDNMYFLYIPSIYMEPDASETVKFEEGDLITIRYNSPVEKAITMGIEELYFNLKPTGYDATPYFTQVSFINASSEEAFEEFITPYSYNITLPLTPFDTFDNGRYMSTIIDLNFTQLEAFLVDGYLDFSHVLITVPYPTHELVLKEIAVFSQSAEPLEVYGSEDISTWQYTRLEMLESGSEPIDDEYALIMEEIPLFYDSTGRWIDYIEITDEDGNYYSAGIVGDQYQLYWNPQTGNFTWNEAFNQYPDYWGIEMELPMMVEANTTLYFRYCTEESWMAPFDLHFENIDYGSLDTIFDYDYLLSPEHEYWYGNYFYNNESDYRIEQFYSESFSTYEAEASHVHEFEISPYNLAADFLNISLYKVVGMYFNLTEKIIEDDDITYDINFLPEENTITISDLDATDGLLNEFDSITIILNFTSGPLSTFTRIQMTSEFNSTFLEDVEDSFFSTTSFNFAYSAPQATMLLGEGANTIASDYTSFAHSEYNTLNMLDAEEPLLENFKKHVDPYHVIHTADLNMDGIAEYKEEIDVNKDGIIDITRYGIENEAATEEEDSILWYKVIQDFSGVERYYDNNVGNTTSTEWFDISDTQFATFHFDYMAILSMIVNPFNIASVFLPELDYWAKRSLSQQFITRATTETQFYSVTEDLDLDGFEDITMTYEKSVTVVYNEVINSEFTIIAAKPQNLLYFMTNYITSSVDALFGAAAEDKVFNEQLTEEMLISGEFPAEYLEKNSLYPTLDTYLTNTYAKVTKESMKSYVNKQEEEKITITQWEEGEIIETRIYTDEYRGSYFDNTHAEVLEFTNINTGEKMEFSEDLTTDYLTKEREGWRADAVPEHFDQLTVYTDDSQESYNLYSDTITIRIPGRFSAYSDHLILDQSVAEQDTQFSVNGIFLTPEDGLVYYTSDLDSFKIDGGNGAKTKGHYLYYDSDFDGFGETVFVLAPYPDAEGVYNVISIGFNYDGDTEFAPYTKVDASEVVLNDNFYEVFGAGKQIGNWVYNFRNLKWNGVIFPARGNKKKDDHDGYELKDSIFEIYKLAITSKQESKYPQLFYEARHKTYDKAWAQYDTQFWKDVGDQVFSTLLAGSVSTAIIAASAGTATGLAHFAYFVIYSLISKFQMDMKAHQADAYQKSQTFYQEDVRHDAPVQLNQKPFSDGFWGDSMPTALVGHPGAYFTTIYGGVPGKEYSAQAIVAPPNELRSVASQFYDILHFIGANLNPFTFGRANPDLFTPLDFDHHNLDYQLVSSELYGYNSISSYNYVESEIMVDYFLDGERNYVNEMLTGPEYATYLLEHTHYYTFRENTLGYITREIKLASDGKYVGIKPYCDDGRPTYAFSEDMKYMAEMPLFEPLIVDEDAYDRLEEQGKTDGYLMVDLSVSGASITKGISPTEMNNVELEHYGAKIPLADQFGGFGYPIKNVTLHAMVDGVPITSKELTPDQYTIDGLGNLYFHSPVGSLLPAFSDDKGYFTQVIPNDYAFSETYYTCVIKIAKVIVDTGSSDLTSSALMQSVMYSIMDFVDVYTFGETTANMIAEIGYTQAMTITSTAITAPVLALGAWATLSTNEVQKQATTVVVNGVQETSVKVASQEVAKITYAQTINKLLGSKTIAGLLTQIAVKTAIGVVSETVEEIVIDGLVETYFQSLVTSMGGSADLGHWVSTLMTTAREAKFFSSFFTTWGEGSQIASISQGLAVMENTISDMNQNQESMVPSQILEQNAGIASQASQLEIVNQEASLSFKKLLKAGLLIGLSLIMPSMAGFNLYAITKTLGGTINQAFTSANNFKPQIQALAQRNRMVSGQALSNFQYTDISSLFYEKPVMDSIIETASPTVETMNSISTPIGSYSFPTSFASQMHSASVYYSPKDNLDGGYNTKTPEDHKKEIMKDLKNELENAETKTTELQETEVPKTQIDPIKDLKGYNSILDKLQEENPDNPIIKDFIKYSKERVREFFYNFRNSYTSKDKGVGQTTLDKFLGTNLRSARLSDMSQVNFERLIKNSDKNGLLYSVYEWKWIGDPSIKFEAEGLSLPLKDLPYTGYSGNFDERINDEVFESLRKYEDKDVLRHHEKAIIQALELERENIIRYINHVSKQFVFDPELGTLEDIHRFITDRTGKPWTIALVKKYIFDRDNVGDSIIGKYFDIRIIEAHSTKALALESEKGLTLIKPHLVEGRPVLGTIFPNGLNMIKGGGGGRGGMGVQSVIFSNFLEIIALATLGLKQKEIMSIMSETITSGEFPSIQSVSRFISKTNFKTFNSLQTFATAEIFWKLIKKYSRTSLINILPFGGGVLDSQLYKGLGYKCSELQRAISMGCDNIDDIQHYLDVESNIFKGFLREEVISFFIDKKIRFEEIALKFGLKNGKCFIGYVKTTLSPALTGGMQLLPIDLRCYLRKQVCIEFLRMGYSPEFILSEIFHYQVFRNEYVNKYTVYSKFRAIFKDEGLNFAEIIEKYCPDPDTIITQYKSKVRIMFQDI